MANRNMRSKNGRKNHLRRKIPLATRLKRVYHAQMALKGKSLEHVQAAVDELIEVLPDCEDLEKQAVKKLIRDLIEFEGRYSGGSPEIDGRNVQPPLSPDAAERLRRTPYYKLGIGQAAIEALRQAGTELSAIEIWEILKEAGVPKTIKDPKSSIGNYLWRKSEKPEAEVMSIGRGQWGLTDWYTPEQIDDFLRKRGGTPTRDPRAHLAATREGMEQAKARGVRLGQPSKITPEIRDEIERRVVNGESVNEIAKAVDLSPSTIRNHYDKKALDEIRAKAREQQEQQEQQRQSPENSRRDFRVITNGGVDQPNQHGG